MYELKDYLNAVNQTKEPLMDTEDEQWEKKYPPFIVNKCLAPFQDTIMLVNEINQLHHLDKKLQYDYTCAVGWIYSNKDMEEELKRTDIDVDQEYRCQYTSSRSSIFGVIKDEAIEDFEVEEYGNK